MEVINNKHIVEYSLTNHYTKLIMTTVLPSNIQEKIVEAAEERFRYYGYRKTTMVEIAADVGMSAANLYRYFSNKEDIGAACVERCFLRMEEVLREVIVRKDISAEEKLLAFILNKLDYIYNETINNPKINELTEMFISERAELLNKKKQVIQSLIAEILAEGNRNGEFAIKDLLNTSESFASATVAFGFPLFMFLYPKDKFQQMAKDVVALLVTGLKTR